MEKNTPRAFPDSRLLHSSIAGVVIIGLSALLIGCPPIAFLTDIQQKVQTAKNDANAPTISSAVGGLHQVTVAWTPVSGATSYNLYWAQGASVTTGNGTKIANAVSPQIISGLANGTQYAFIVTSLTASGESRPSAVSFVTTSCSVTYNANVPNGQTLSGGSVPVDSTGYQNGQTVTVIGNTGNLTVTSFTFAGWNTKADLTGTTYNAPATFGMGNSDMTLFACWTQSPTYTASYNANVPSGQTLSGGSVPVDSNNYLQGAIVTVQGNTGNLAVSGYAFSGWNTQANGSGILTTHRRLSPWASAILPFMPSGRCCPQYTYPVILAVGAPTATTLAISWNVSSDAASYQLYSCDKRKRHLWTLVVYSGSATNLADTGLSANTTFYYEVQATNPIGSSAPSSAVSGTTLPSSTR